MPSATATPDVAGCDGAGDHRVMRRRVVDDAFDLGLVRFGGQQLVEVLGAEQAGQHLAVELHEQRIAARPGDQRVELAVELGGTRPAPCRDGTGRRPLGSRRGRRRTPGAPPSSMIGSSSARRVSNSWRTNSLRSSPHTDAHVGQMFGDVRPVAAPLDHPERQQALDRLAHRGPRHLELFGEGPLRRHLRPRFQVAGRDPLEQPVADQRAERFPGDRLEGPAPERTAVLPGLSWVTGS